MKHKKVNPWRILFNIIWAISLVLFFGIAGTIELGGPLWLFVLDFLALGLCMFTTKVLFVEVK